MALERRIVVVRAERYTCVKCGKQFTKMVGGIVLSPGEWKLALYPVCDKCKLNKVKDILGLKE